MKKIKINLSALFSRLCAVAVGLLGFGCESNIECMYGMPTGSFEVKGSVTDTEGNPVEGAEVRFGIPDAPSDPYSILKGKSGANGEYSLKDSGVPLHGDSYKVVCIPEDDSLRADSIIVEPKYVKSKKDKDEWSVGHAEIAVDFRLKKKSE